MKSRSKFKEMALVSIPAAMLLGLALYWARVEALSAPGGSQMFISKVELTTANGLSSSEGISHYLTVTIDHPWPRPKWWGKGQMANDEVEALQTPTKLPAFRHARGERPGQFLYLGSGGALTWSEAGQRKRFQAKKYALMGSGYWKDDSLVFRHALRLQEAPTKPELTFDGLYIVEGQPPLRLHRVIRKTNEVLPWSRSHDTGGKIASVRVQPFVAELPINVPHEDRCDISIFVFHKPREDGKAPSISGAESNLELIDGRGRNLKIDQRNITLAYPGRDRKNTVTTTEYPFILEIKRSYATQEPLTLRGKISVDNNWPIPFSLRLPPRPR